MNRLLKGLSVALVALCLPGVVLAGTGGGDFMPSEQTYFAGGDKVVDLANDVALDLPAGWSATVPGEGALGAMTASNYDKASADLSNARRGTHTLTSDMAKFDVITYEMGNARTVAAWVKQYQAQPNIDGVVMATSETISYQLAGRQGQAYVLYAAEHSPLVVVLPWTAGKVLLAAVAPANSVNMERALAILDTLRPVSAEAQASPGRDLVTPVRELVDAEIARAGGSLSNLVTDATAAQCTSWTGTDNGACATGHSCAGNTPITLNLPFQYLTWWMAGGVGSFFGNYYHGNCNKDYYAIDFNLYTSSSCSSAANDIGQNVYAAANGTASSGYEAGGYGNWVLVVHASNVRTRYAHLSSIKVSSGSVTTQTVVGLVGDSGSAAGAPHLHLAFQGKNTSGVYVSYCNKSGGCPNGEGAVSPQSAKPSPQYTAGGSRAMTDGGCFQGPP